MAAATLSLAPARSRPARSSKSKRVRSSRPARVPVRRGLVARVRARIAAGVYETEPMLDAAIARLLAEIA